MMIIIILEEMLECGSNLKIRLDLIVRADLSRPRNLSIGKSATRH
jgi:hypothetical protein